MEGRRPIHYGIFLAVGVIMAGMSGFSLMFSQGANHAAMQLFLGIGLLFLLMGVIKFIIKKVSQVSDNEEKFRKKLSGVGEINREERKMSRNAKQKNPPATPNNIISCPRCQARNYGSSNYCHMCGLRLKQNGSN